MRPTVVSFPSSFLWVNVSVVLVFMVPITAGSMEIWRVSSPPPPPPPDTASSTASIFEHLLQPFQPVHHAWGADSLSFSNKHGNSLDVHYRQGSYTKTSHRGGAFYSTPAQLHDDVDNLILMYDVYFESFGWGNMGKLPGLFGGEKGEGAYKCSGGHNPSTCFSLRLMWRNGGDGELYAYISDNQADGFESREDVETNYDYGHSLARGKIHFRNGEWQTVLEQVHLNSDPDTADGRVKLCVTYQDDSNECYTIDNLVIRKNRQHHFRGFVFSTFFGGGSLRDAAPNDCHAYFRNFRLKYPSSDVHVG